MRCSALAEELDEPMTGTVDQRIRWLLVEDRSPWGSDAVKDAFGADATALAKQLSLRLLLIRRREGDPAADVVRRAILVDTEAGEMATLTIADPAELPVQALSEVALAEFGDPMRDPVFLVCTNGKRDACCALRGRALMGAMAAAGHADRTWECTHLGGHRFAANLVCLPDGIVYGRVSAHDGPRLADAYLEGRVDPAHVRGRSAWHPAAQVAEQVLRERLGLRGIGDVRLETVHVDGDRAEMTLVTPDGRRHELAAVAERAMPSRPTSCRADELEEPVHWRVGVPA